MMKPKRGRRVILKGLALFSVLASFEQPLLAQEPASDHFQRGKNAKRLGNLNTAIEEFLAALKTSDKGIVHYELGLLYLVKARTEEAIAELEKALQKEDLPAEAKGKAHSMLALAFLQQGKLKKAKISIAAALTESPNDFAYLQRSIEICLASIKENPISSENHLDLGKAWQQAGKFDHALAEYNQALLFDPKNAAAKDLIQKLPEAKQEYDQARSKSKT